MSESLPTVSVVVATHNRPQLLRKALASILGQDYPGVVQVVLVFDRADPEYDLASDDPRRTVVVTTNTATPGLPGARNSGIALTDGDWVAFCDDDDWWDPDKLARQLARLQASPAAIACCCGIVVHFGDELTARVPHDDDLTVAALLRERVFAAHPSGYLIRRDLIVEGGAVGPVDEQIPGGYGEDHDLLLRIAKTGTIVAEPAPLVHVLWGATSYFQTKWQILADAMDYLTAKHPEFARDPIGLARLNGRKAFALAAMGRKAEARSLAISVLKVNPKDLRAIATMAVATGAVRAETLLAQAHKRGRGI